MEEPGVQRLDLELCNRKQTTQALVSPPNVNARATKIKERRSERERERESVCVGGGVCERKRGVVHSVTSGDKKFGHRVQDSIPHRHTHTQLVARTHTTSKRRRELTMRVVVSVRVRAS
jgi:hypothetical protein